jgi:hypothetical protein
MSKSKLFTTKATKRQDIANIVHQALKKLNSETNKFVTFGYDDIELLGLRQ